MRVHVTILMFGRNIASEPLILCVRPVYASRATYYFVFGQYMPTEPLITLRSAGI